MSVADDVNEGINAARQIRFPRWSWLPIILGSLPIYWLFDRFGRLNIALPALNFVLVVCFLLVVKRKLQRYTWFWITMVVIVAVHVPLFLLVPWTTKWIPALMIAVIDSVDFCLMLWIISAVGKFIGNRKTTEG